MGGWGALRTAEAGARGFDRLPRLPQDREGGGLSRFGVSAEFALPTETARPGFRGRRSMQSPATHGTPGGGYDACRSLFAERRGRRARTGVRLLQQCSAVSGMVRLLCPACLANTPPPPLCFFPRAAKPGPVASLHCERGGQPSSTFKGRPRCRPGAAATWLAETKHAAFFL